jgi:hypothetical protein
MGRGRAVDLLLVSSQKQLIFTKSSTEKTQKKPPSNNRLFKRNTNGNEDIKTKNTVFHNKQKKLQ